MAKFNIAVQWSMFGYFEVEADSLEEAKEMVFDPDPIYNLSNANGEYINHSFTVEDDGCYLIEE